MEAAQDFWLAKLGKAGNFNRWVYDSIAPHLSGDILEIGCGTGTFTGLMAASGHRVTAVDVNPTYVEAAGRRLSGQGGVRLIAGDATKMSWPTSFDTVVMLDVLEHIEDDAGFLRQLGASLKPGGQLVVKVPAGEWLYSPMDRAIGHFRRYTKKTLRRTFEAAGFATTHQRYFNMAGVAGWWLNGRLLKRTTPPQEQIAIFESIVPVLRAVEAVARPFGLSVIACGAKRD